MNKDELIKKLNSIIHSRKRTKYYKELKEQYPNDYAVLIKKRRGSVGKYERTDRQKKIMSKRMKKQHKIWKNEKPEWYKQKIEALKKNNLGKTFSQEHRAKISLANKGKTVLESTRKKMSINMSKRHKRWRETDPKGYFAHQNQASKLGASKGGIAVHLKHPYLGKQLGQWAKNNKQFYRKQKLKWNLENPLIVEQVSNNLVKWGNEHPEHRIRASKLAHVLNPTLAHDNGLKMVQSCTKKGIKIPLAENLMRKMLPKDFFHNVILGNTVPDFHSLNRKIVIEVDGEHHYRKIFKEKDKIKQKEWITMGYTVFRFRNKDVLEISRTLGVKI